MARNGKRLGLLPGWRMMTYVVLAFNVIMLVWIIAGVATTTHNPNCGQTDQFFTQQDCQAATDAGAGIGAGILVVLWTLGDIILGVLWLVTNRKKSRECPACGWDVKKGHFACRNCGFDFRSLIQPTAPYPAAPTIRIPEQGAAPQPVTNAQIREWARGQGYEVSDRGRVPVAVVEAFHTSAR